MADDTLAFQTDPMLELLTDALRDGPGSPKWHEAIRQLSELQPTIGSVDEYRLLIQAREHLESGKDFRSIRPGPAFTRRVMTAIDNDGKQPAGGSALRWLVMVCVLLIAVGVVTLAIWIMPHTSPDQTEASTLSQAIFGRPLLTLDTEQAPNAADGQWRLVGNLPLTFDHGIQVQHAAPLATVPIGGGVATVTPMLAENPFDVDVKFQISGDGDDVVPEIAVSDVNDFSSQTAAASHELVWALQGRQAKVILPDGKLAAQADVGGGPREINVRVKLGAHVALIDIDGKTIWSGVCELSADAKRYVAVRLIRRSRGDKNSVTIRSAGVLAER